MSYGCRCGCETFREHALGVNISAHATPTRSGAARVIDVDSKDAQWAIDAPAYKRLRKQGYQPPDVEGSAHLERHAKDPFEIERGKIIDEKVLTRVREGKEQLKEKGIIT